MTIGGIPPLEWCDDCQSYHDLKMPCKKRDPSYPPVVLHHVLPPPNPLADIQERLTGIEKLLREIKWKSKTRKT